MTASRARNILFVHAGAELYGADKILLVLAAGLVARGWGVTIVLPWAGELKPLLERCGAEVLVMNHGVLRRKYFSPCGLLNRAWLIAKTGLYLARLVEQRRIDIVHTNTSVVMAGAVAAALAKVPHFWHIHEITTRPKVVWKALSWLIPRGASRVVCVSRAVLSHLCEGNGRNKSVGLVIHNGINPLSATDDERRRIRRELGLTDNQVLVGMIGRVNAWKGQMALAEAAVQVAQRRPDVHFLFVGGTFAGEEHLLESLRERVSKEDLLGRATVWDFRSDVGAIMAALDVFALPSIQPDPLPTVVLEAMSLGRPIVAFRHGGVCEMVDDGATGLLVPVGDVGAFASALLGLIESSSLRTTMGLNGQARFQRAFSVGAFLDAWETAYGEAIAR